MASVSDELPQIIRCTRSLFVDFYFIILFCSIEVIIYSVYLMLKECFFFSDCFRSTVLPSKENHSSRLEGKFALQSWKCYRVFNIESSEIKRLPCLRYAHFRGLCRNDFFLLKLRSRHELGNVLRIERWTRIFSTRPVCSLQAQFFTPVIFFKLFIGPFGYQLFFS
jgi:hypothetical protein